MMMTSMTKKAYQKLKDYHLTSTQAMIEYSTILAYITSAKLGYDSWNGCTKSFITIWQHEFWL
jgi:hypothetical protein